MIEEQKMTKVLRVLNELNNGEIVLSKLAGDMRISVRTIQRYIIAIEAAGFPLCSPTPGTWSFVEGFSLQKMKLTENEACLLVLFNDFIDSLQNDTLAKTFQIFKNRALSDNTKNPFYIKFDQCVPYETNIVSQTLQKAIENQKKIHIRLNNKTNLKFLSPLTIANFSGFWYLLCLGYEDKMMKFRMNTIKEATITDEDFETNRKALKAIEESKNIWFEIEANIEVKLQINKEIVEFFKNKQYLPYQKFETENPDGSAIISCKVAKEQELIYLMFTWLPHIKILSPENLATRVKQILSEYLETSA
jgi:predicted DNA-binding transcriptional regulator YafY